MNQISSTATNRPLLGAGYMLAAGIGFAAVNVATQYAGMVAGINPATTAFFQYFIALLFALPWIARTGFGALATRHPLLHVARVVLSAIGVQLWVSALAVVPIWQGIALLMTSPFFVVAGAVLFLGERVTFARIGATVMGFTGAVIILQPWSASFTWYALLPVGAAALWAGMMVITKYLTRDEKSESITIYLLLLLTPINAAFFLAGGAVLPDANGWLVLVALGLATAFAQYLLTRAYSVADATYLQPFDDLKLPLNILLGWLVFATAPDVAFWPGAALIVAASLLIMRQEAQKRRQLAAI